MLRGVCSFVRRPCVGAGGAVERQPCSAAAPSALPLYFAAANGPLLRLLLALTHAQAPSYPCPCRNRSGFSCVGSTRTLGRTRPAKPHAGLLLSDAQTRTLPASACAPRLLSPPAPPDAVLSPFAWMAAAPAGPVLLVVPCPPRRPVDWRFHAQNAPPASSNVPATTPTTTNAVESDSGA